MLVLRIFNALGLTDLFVTLSQQVKQGLPEGFRSSVQPTVELAFRYHYFDVALFGKETAWIFLAVVGGLPLYQRSIRHKKQDNIQVGDEKQKHNLG